MKATPPQPARDVAAQMTAFYDRELPERSTRPLTEDREKIVHAFAGLLAERGASTVLEVGCGGGRDGVALVDAGLNYRGCDLSPGGVQTCRALGLTVDVAEATVLPYADDAFDAAWSMSTLMHLPPEDFPKALAELRRVVRPGGLVEIGVWGGTADQEWTGDPHGRYFYQRSDTSLRRELSALGEVEAFDTWAATEDGGHYQWARVLVSP